MLIQLPDIPLILPASDELVLDKYISRGLQPDETELPHGGGVFAISY